MNISTRFIACRRSSCLALVTAGAVAASLAPLLAADGSGNQNWTTTSNWVSGSVPSATTDNATLGTATNRTVNVDSAQSINWLAWNANAGNYIVNGSQLTLNSTGTSSSTAALRAGGGSGQSLTFNNAINFTAATAFMDLNFLGTSGAGSLIFNGAVTSSGSINTLARSFSNTTSQLQFNGSVNLNSGAGSLTLQLSGLTTTLSGTNTWNTLALAQAGNATLKLASDGALTAGSTLSLAGDTNRIQAVNAGRSYNVNVNMNNAAGAMTQSFDGSYDLTFSGTTTLSKANASQTIDVASTRVSFTGNWTGNATAGLIKQGNGTLVIGSGGTTTVAFGAGTTISAGTLLVNGSMGDVTGTADIVTVNNGGTLGGTGSIARETTVNSGGSVSAGDSAVNNGIGTLTFSAGGGNFIGANGAVFKFDLNGTGTTNDLVVTNGGLSLATGNTYTFDFANLGLGSYAANTWVAIWTNSAAWGTNFTGNTFSIGTLTGGLTGGEFQLSGNDLQVRFSAVPEPSTWLLLTASLTVASIFRRRRV